MQPESGLERDLMEASEDNSVDTLLPGQTATGGAPGDFKFNLADRSPADPEQVLADFLEAMESITAVPAADLRSIVDHSRACGLRPARALLMSQVVSRSDFDGAERRQRDSVRLVPEMVNWDIAGLLPQQFCLYSGIIAYQRDDEDRILVAHSSRLDEYAHEVLADSLGDDYKAVWADQQAIGSCWQLKPLDSADEGDDAAAIRHDPAAVWNDLTSQTGGFMSESTGLQLSHMFVYAAVKGASDIHIEGTTAGQMEVRYRSLGRMKSLMNWPLALGEQIVNRLRVVAKVKDNPSALADARFAVFVPEHGVFNVRLSFCPTYVGQMVVMRMLSAQAGAERSLEDVWPSDHSPPNRLSMAERIKGLLASRSDGIVLVAGRTGDGKTTSLAAMLSEFCKRGDMKVLTAEHPVEYAIPGAQQVDIAEWHGDGPPPEGYKTWGNVLRAFLRSDPNVIMIGEIRDEETARIAIRAAQTGHIVLATIHVRDAASAPARLIDMAPGTEALLSESLNGVLAQRLIRTICVACRGRSEDCPKCGGEGFDAQTAVGELLVVDKSVREAIAQKESPTRLVREAMKDQSQIVDALAHLIQSKLTTEAEVEWSFGSAISAEASAKASSPEWTSGNEMANEEAA